MKFTITNVDTNKIEVSYENGTKAYIATVAGADKAYYADLIKRSLPVAPAEVAIDDVPYKKDDTGTVGDDIPTAPEEKLDYRQARYICYPPLENVMNSLYPFVSGGTDSEKIKIDAHIKLIQDGIPADSTEYTYDEAQAKLTEFKKDSAFIQ
tara:strand:- start:380 stop:835 length:456 start_codon:yes stop_codon:yes gene_type:complete